MEALKWLGCIAAAILLLSILLGVGAIIGTLVSIGGAVLIFGGMVVLIAAAIRGVCTSKK